MIECAQRLSDESGAVQFYWFLWLDRKGPLLKHRMLAHDALTSEQLRSLFGTAAPKKLRQNARRELAVGGAEWGTQCNDSARGRVDSAE